MTLGSAARLQAPVRATVPTGRADAGWSFVELIVATAIVGIAMLVMLQQMTISYRETGSSEERAFAYQKALAMASELQSSVERGVIPDALALETYDDQGTPNPVLTTLLDSNGNPVAADHMMSGNLQQHGDWAWWRVISIDPMEASGRMRYVRVTIKRRAPNGRLLPAASLALVINLPLDAYPPTQVHDVYAIGIDAIPCSGGTLDGMRTALDSAVASMRAKMPGLDFRVHAITKSGYGRDTRYVPYLNTVSTASSAATDTYWYPSDLGEGKRLFVPELFSGRVRTDAGVLNDYDASTNPYPHAVADRFNHCKRTPAARALHASRVLAGSESVDEPPLQLLLEDMWANPDDYRNAILVNLHGEVLPCPPLRNYSDAAKSTSLPGFRAVTHPERLWTPRDPDANGNHADTGDMAFRVYAYKTESAGVGDTVPTITLQFHGVDLTGNVNGLNGSLPTSLTVENLPGGVDRGGTLAGDYSYAADFGPAKQSVDSPQPAEMWFELGYETSPAPYTWLRLHNTPAVAPLVSGRGLHADARLYDLDYVPSPVVADGSFSADLALLDTTARPKNTARWRVVIPAGIFDVAYPGTVLANYDAVVTLSTRIGTDLGTGAAWPLAVDQANLSDTYGWWTSSPLAIPPTERYQFVGDPRLNPYADLAAGGASFPHGYNRFFDDLETSGLSASPSDWPCFDFARLQDGGAGGNTIDEPRFMALWRECLQGCGAVWSQADGLVAGASGLGGEISGPRNGLGELEPSVISLASEFFGVSGAIIEFDALAADPSPIAPAPMLETAPPAAATLHGRTLVVDRSSTFWAKPWLGELAPDDYAAFATDGNLATSRFHHELRELTSFSNLPIGTEFGFASGSRSGPAGPADFVGSPYAEGGPVEQVQHPASAQVEWNTDVSSYLSILGLEPEIAMPLRWPLRIHDSGHVPPAHWSDPTAYPWSELTPLESLGSVEGFAGEAGGIAAVRSLADSSRAMFVATLGVHAPDAAERQRAMAQALALGVRALHVAGSPVQAESVRAVPLLKIVAPSGVTTLEDPPNFVVQWQTPFVRFDDRPYTSDYGPAWSDDESLLGYVVLVSADDGTTWFHPSDGAPAELGERIESTSPYWLPDTGAGDESFQISTPEATYPEGDYLIRVECHHATDALHYAHHQQSVSIER